MLFCYAFNLNCAFYFYATMTDINTMSIQAINHKYRLFFRALVKGTSPQFFFTLFMRKSGRFRSNILNVKETVSL